MKCSRCGKDVINYKKYRINNCICGAKLLVIEVNKKFIVEDVTPELKEFRRGKIYE